MAAQSKIPLWVNNYIGLPFAEHGRDERGVDCWGLLRLVYADMLDIHLPSYDEGYKSTQDGKTLDRLIRDMRRSDWCQVKREDARPFDAIHIRFGRYGMHTALVVAPGMMLHVEQGIDACIEDFTTPKWRNRILNYWRHREVPDDL